MAVEICIFYVREDEWLLQELEKQFSVLVQQKLVTVWHEGHIASGMEWVQAMTMHMRTAQIILFLLSPDFIASEHYSGASMQLALQRQEQGEVHVIPVILRPVDWQFILPENLKVLPDNLVPVTLWQDRDQAWLHIIQGVRKVVAEITGTVFTPHPAQETISFNDNASSGRKSPYQVSIGRAEGVAIGDGASVNYGVPAEDLIKIFKENTRKNMNMPEQRVTQMADVLLVTVTEVETKAILAVFPASTRCFIDEKTYYDFGVVSGARVYLVRSEMGAGGPGGAFLTIAEAIKALRPTSVIMVGIAFGMRPEQHHIGELLVSRQITEYELQRISTHADGQRYVLPRGDRVYASVRLLDRFRDAALNWQGKKVHFGLLLSGAKLVDNQEFKERLRAIEPEAIGGEMEGAGLYAAAQRSKVDWILVKGICDWADGNKQRNKNRYQQQAASQAAQFTFHVIQQGGFHRVV